MLSIQFYLKRLDTTNIAAEQQGLFTTNILRL